jgi:hypothetical protein
VAGFSERELSAFSVHRMRGISRLAEGLVSSEEGISSTELISQLITYLGSYVVVKMIK